MSHQVQVVQRIHSRWNISSARRAGGRSLRAGKLLLAVGCGVFAGVNPALAYINQSPCVTAQDAHYASQYIVPFHNHTILQQFDHSGFLNCQNIPGLGQTSIYDNSSIARFMYSANNGQTFSPVTVSNVSFTVSIRHMSDLNGVAQLTNEMTALNISGGGLPPGVMIRESPTLRSSGFSTVEPYGNAYKVESFFDIFTELSMDGGQTWTPAASPIRMALQPNIPTIPTVSQWGLIILSLLLLTVGTVFILRRRSLAATTVAAG